MQLAHLVEARHHAVADGAELIEGAPAAGEERVQLIRHRRRPPRELGLSERRPRHAGAARAEREVHLSDDLTEPHQLREEGGILLVDRGTTFHRVRGTHPLSGRVQVAQ